ncbi:HNH endonuclease [Arthrobacter sp. MSA 4-2]|uniref:GmrSD restriction endonuclease domain-containing protein n=1 Tax=Arthrobacter sp. MSA 4-2 TaxID=2794349 RepID=UPI0018E75396|nr:HNH endonuclease family protein [Arthrobacter sp. MSA 4-2]MBJ2120952.1 HNH endonuclease [Arthrobacter sp. MSA 4-2]
MKIKAGLIAAFTAGLLFTGITVPADAGTTYTTNLRAAARALPLAAENNLGYDRARYFGSGWIDTNRDCQYTRAEVLISETRVAPTYSSGGCTVTAGRWVTSWDNKVHTSPTTVQIDHLVPVAEAWGSGARNWTQARRVTFYNDLYAHSLNAQTNLLNQQKQAKGPEDWMPPANQCSYIAQWVMVKTRWGMTVDSREKAVLVQKADQCPAASLTVVKY